MRSNKLPANRARLFQLDRFWGVNESPDGDVGLKRGEAAQCRNFRITKEGNLQIRPGYKTMLTLAAGAPVRGLFCGSAGGEAYFLAACGGHLWRVDPDTWVKTDLGTLADAETRFFGFGGHIYLLNCSQYKVWNGTSLADVAGYVPVVTLAADPATGAGAEHEPRNLLTASRIVHFSGTAGTTLYQLPETALSSVDSVYVDDVCLTPGTHYTAHPGAGTVTFTAAPGAGVNNVKVCFTKHTAQTAANRALILSQRCSERFNGDTDNRVFLYGGGTNRVYYSGIAQETGLPSAEYFPVTGYCDVGAANTPVTALVRHFSHLMAFKTDETYLIFYGTATLADGRTAAGFTLRAVDRNTGHSAPGAGNLVNNYPISLHGNSAYRWSLLASSGTHDERAAKRISDHVGSTISGMDLSCAVTFDDEYAREFWIIQGGAALLWNYSGEVDYGKTFRANAWSVYTGLPATHMVRVGGRLCFGTAAGSICVLDSAYRSDDGAPIEAYWESGSMDFGAQHLYKAIGEIYTTLKPELGARLQLTVETNERSACGDRLIGSSVLHFVHATFAHWSFLSNGKPRTVHTRIHANRFTTLKLILKSNSVSASATVLTCTIPVTFTGKAK